MVFALLKKEFILELRRKSAVSGIVLYLFSLVFISYLTFSLRRSVIDEGTWSALFWLTILFSVVNSVAKSFIGEKKGVMIYLYSMASPQAIILSKMVYNSILCSLLSWAGYALFKLFMQSPIVNEGLFMLTLVLTSIGFAASLSLISGIAAKANNSHVLMAVLSFPVVISILLMAIKITKNIIMGMDLSGSSAEVLNLLAINSIAFALSYLLFPYIWRS